MGLFDFSFGFSNNNAQVGLNKWDTDWLYQQQSDRWRANTDWYNRNGYSLMKQGLMNAGYNPLMALGATPMSGATVSGSVMDERTNASSFNSSGIPLGSQALKAQMLNTNADTSLKNAMAEENMSRSNLENVEKVLKDKEVPYADRKQAAITRGLELSTQETQARIRNIEATTGLQISERQLNQFRMQYTRALTSLTHTQQQHFNRLIAQIDNGISLSSADRAFIEHHPDVAEFISGAKAFGGAISSIITPIATVGGAYALGAAKAASNASQLIQQSGNHIKVSPRIIQY